MIKSLNLSNLKLNFNSLNNPFYLISPILLIGLHLGFTSYFICLLFILLRLLTTNKDTAGIFLVLFGGLVGGITRHVYPGIPLYGSILILLGLLLLSGNVAIFLRNGKKTVLLSGNIAIFLRNGKKSIFFLLLVISVFFVSYLYGPHHHYSNSKLLAIIIFGFLSLFIYSIINISKRFSSIAISQLLLLTTVSLYVASIESFGYKGPSSFFDYSWFRLTTSQFVTDYQISVIDYQAIGMNALYAFAFFIGSEKVSMNTNKFYRYLFYATCFQLILMSGARQAIFGLGLLVFVRIAIFSQVPSFSKRLVSILLGILILFIFVKFISSLNIDFLSTVLASDGDLKSITGRADNILRAYSIIRENPFFGVGLGGYSPKNMSIYPHNVILEILSECGIIGLTALILVLVYFYKSNRYSIKLITTNGLYLIIILTALLIRAFVSSDLSESIALFSGIFAMAISRKENFNYINEEK